MNTPTSTKQSGAAQPATRRRRNWVVRHWLAVVIATASVLAGAIGFVVGERRFTDVRATAEAGIDTYVSVLTQARKVRDGRSELAARVQSVADRTLGPSLEVVDSEVRRRLNRACEELGIVEFSVTTGTSVAKPTPAKREFKQSSERPLRDEADFVEVEATVIASGSAGKMYRLLHRVQIEPWLKRIESVRLDPTADGSTVRMTVKLRTIYLPGTIAKQPLVIDAQALAKAERFLDLFAANPFRIPPPPPVQVQATLPTSVESAPDPGVNGAAAAPPNVPTPVSPFPYGEWQLTGVVDGSGGPEAWLRHLPTGSQLTLQPGSAVGELVFRRVEYDFGVFDGPGGTCRVQVGSNLTQRSAAAG